MKKEVYGYIEGFGEGPDANGDIIEGRAWEEAVLKNERVAHEAGVGPILTKDFNLLQVLGQVQKIEKDKKGIKVTAKLNDDGVAFLESQARRFGQTLAQATNGGVFAFGGYILEKKGNTITKMKLTSLSYNIDPDDKTKEWTRGLTGPFWVHWCGLEISETKVAALGWTKPRCLTCNPEKAK